jgi:hypothetical protein
MWALPFAGFERLCEKRSMAGTDLRAVRENGRRIAGHERIFKLFMGRPILPSLAGTDLRVQTGYIGNRRAGTWVTLSECDP